jgi:hypothetical protein
LLVALLLLFSFRGNNNRDSSTGHNDVSRNNFAFKKEAVLVMKIRNFMPGDDVAQVGIYNEAAAALPKFKAATLDEIRRRCHAPNFDPTTHFYAEDNGLVVGYATFQPNGRVSFPWTRTSHEAAAGPLFDAVLQAMKSRGIMRAFAAYRADWTSQRDFFLQHDFPLAREMVNFVMDLAELPTPSARPNNSFSTLTREDLPTILKMAPHLLRAQTVNELEQHLFDNPYFPLDATFALRNKADGTVLAIGIVVVNDAYANPKLVDSAMPCFRLGAFGTEGLTHKRITGLFSFLADLSRDVNPLALDILGQAAMRLDATDVETIAAQVPSDVTPLLRFYKQYFRRQGSFPIYERTL